MDFTRPVQAVIPGAQGRILAVLTETTAELNLRTIAHLAGISQAQASRVLPRLVALGLVERREVPPSSLFRLVPEHVAAGPVLALARVRSTTMAEMGRIAANLPISPLSAIVFGSFARGEAVAGSDIDTVLVRPAEIPDSDDRWATTVEEWSTRVSRLTGNPVEVFETGPDEIAAQLAAGKGVWEDIHRDGIVVHGLRIDQLLSADG